MCDHPAAWGQARPYIRFNLQAGVHGFLSQETCVANRDALGQRLELRLQLVQGLKPQRVTSHSLFCPFYSADGFHFKHTQHHTDTLAFTLRSRRSLVTASRRVASLHTHSARHHPSQRLPNGNPTQQTGPCTMDGVASVQHSPVTTLLSLYSRWAPAYAGLSHQELLLDLRKQVTYSGRTRTP